MTKLIIVVVIAMAAWCLWQWIKSGIEGDED